MTKRAYDLAVCIPEVLIVLYHLNDTKIDCKSLRQIRKLLFGESPQDNPTYERVSSRWEIVTLNPFQSFEQVSFVNGICTYRGGKHVDYVLNQVVKSWETIF